MDASNWTSSVSMTLAVSTICKFTFSKELELEHYLVLRSAHYVPELMLRLQLLEWAVEGFHRVSLSFGYSLQLDFWMIVMEIVKLELSSSSDPSVASPSFFRGWKYEERDGRIRSVSRAEEENSPTNEGGDDDKPTGGRQNRAMVWRRWVRLDVTGRWLWAGVPPSVCVHLPLFSPATHCPSRRQPTVLPPTPIIPPPLELPDMPSTNTQVGSPPLSPRRRAPFFTYDRTVVCCANAIRSDDVEIIGNILEKPSPP
ncbi:early nodulin-like protein 11 [Striga asiatica]|uniref:Early nodulin-like protein 11 n=1 Tax=Striga asiatica TaxID=4170 RepID=A0A5A7P777_STRAF|nr:early nodulin-like protein 11 [Striga asiatica]